MRHSARSPTSPQGFGTSSREPGHPQALQPPPTGQACPPPRHSPLPASSWTLSARAELPTKCFPGPPCTRPGSSVIHPRLSAIAAEHPLQHPREPPIEGLVTAQHPLTSASRYMTFCCPPHFEDSSDPLPPPPPILQSSLAGHKPPMRPAEATSVWRT